VPTFADRGVSRGQRGGTPTVVKLSFLDRYIYIYIYIYIYVLLRDKHFTLNVDYGPSINRITYQQLWGFRDEEKLHLSASEQKS
jgi:hypothetical protein